MMRLHKESAIVSNTRFALKTSSTERVGEYDANINVMKGKITATVAPSPMTPTRVTLFLS